MWHGDFFTSSEGQRLLARHRERRRLHVMLAGIEPRGKSSMPEGDERNVRLRIRERMATLRRRPYRGALILSLGFGTTERNPSHIHTLAKNFLDLLGRAGTGPLAGHSLLYSDDAQVHGLVVNCEHGRSKPEINIESRSLGEFRNDLALAMHAQVEEPNAQEDREGAGALAIEHWSRDEFVRLFGEEAWRREGIRYQQAMQRSLLQGNGFGVRDLAYLFHAPDLHLRHHEQILEVLSDRWQQHLRESPFRITLEELPQRPGSSGQYREHVLDSLRSFRSEYERVLSPIRIPVGLEVIVKPPHSTHASALHDLDNVLRRYLVPGIVEMFEPPSHVLWADEGAYFQRAARSIKKEVPASTAIGLIRMEAWRIPRSSEDVSAGYVSVALVPDAYGNGGSLRAVDRAVDRWLDRD